MRKFLVVVRAGDDSKHETWFQGEQERSWDLIISYYGNDPDKYRDNCLLRVDQKGPKYSAMASLMNEFSEKIYEYDYVMFPDDDLVADLKTINRFFEICQKYNLEIAQPALSDSSFFSHLATMVNERFVLRYTNFIEIMVPCFSRDFLKRCAATFKDSASGWGLDFLWPSMVTSPSSIGIVDAAFVHHVRPIGGPTHGFFARIGIDLYEEANRVLKKYNVQVKYPVAFGGVTAEEKALWVNAASHGEFISELIAGYLPLVGKRDFNFLPLIRENLGKLPPCAF